MVPCANNCGAEVPAARARIAITHGLCVRCSEDRIAMRKREPFADRFSRENAGIDDAGWTARVRA